jgi:L-lactate dehydrogenase complex protein LldF
MLLALRAKLAEGDSNWDVRPVDRTEALMFNIWAWLLRHRSVYDLVIKLAGIGQKVLPQKSGMLRWLPPPMNGWTRSRDIRSIAAESFIQRWRKGL